MPVLHKQYNLEVNHYKYCDNNVNIFETSITYTESVLKFFTVVKGNNNNTKISIELEICANGIYRLWFCWHCFLISVKGRQKVFSFLWCLYASSCV